MSHDEQKLNRKLESFERTQSLENTSVDALISTRTEQDQAHEAAHKDDITLSDTSLKALTSGSKVDYEPLMLVDLEADGRVRALATSDAPPSFIELKALEMEATNNPALEPVVELKRFARTLPAGQEKSDMNQLAQDLARSLRAKELLPQTSDAACDKLPAITPTFSLSATIIDSSPDITPAGTNTFYPERLADFAGNAASRAVDFLTDEQALSQFVEDEREKFIGIGEGLNEAKENVKALARAGWTGVTDGTAVMMMLKACDIGHDLELVLTAGCAVGSWLYNEVPHLGEKLSQASDRYSHMSKRDQGRVIGNAMFDFLSVDAAIEFPHLFSKGLKNEIANEKAVDNILQVLVSSARDRAGQLGVERIRSVLSVAKEFVTSPEFHKLVEESVFELVQTGPRRVLAPAGVPFDEQFLMMAMDGKGGDGIGESIRKIWREIRDKPLTPKQLREREENVAREIMTSKMVDKVAENTEHHMRCRKAVFELPFDDLIALYIREHKFIFPETLESIFKKEAKMSAELPDAGDILCKHLPGVTLKIGTDKVKTVSVVPLKYVDSQSNALVESAKFHLAEGILRHEAGNNLVSITNGI
ncbi:MAG: hypothetical protein IPG59_01565 [Candidatus Melainabacteria bacterium]|nr:MAG: hypothetical protein IPG59_01565 [Candidatus Melainabacteria bacterium]